MQFRSVTFVLIEAILGKVSAKVTHDPVPRYLRNHTGGSDAQADAITVDDYCLRKRKRDHRQAVYQNVIGRFEERFDRQTHGAVACAQNVDPVDLDGIDNSDSPPHFRAGNQLEVDFLAQFRRKLFGIVQVTMTEFFGENHCRRYDWTCQRTATGFINPGNARDSYGAEFFLVTKSAAPVHPRKSLADLRQ